MARVTYNMNRLVLNSKGIELNHFRQQIFSTGSRLTRFTFFFCHIYLVAELDIHHIKPICFSVPFILPKLRLLLMAH